MSRPRTLLHARRRSAFTLVELLVVVLIIVLISAALIPAIMPALNSRRVSEGSRILQSELSRARDLAVRANAPRGFRLIPDAFDPSLPFAPLTCSRLIPLEPGPDYTEGSINRYFQTPAYPPGPYPNAIVYQPYPPPPGLPRLGANANNRFFKQFPGEVTNPPNIPVYPYLVLRQEKAYRPATLPAGSYVPNSPTSWFYNLRQGERLRFSDSGGIYTVAGPIVNPATDFGATTAPAPPASITNPSPASRDAANPQRFINYGPNYVSTITPATNLQRPAYDFLFLVNDNDDDGDGFKDEGFDGLDNDGDGYIDPGFNGVDDNRNGFIDEQGELYLHFDSGSGAFVYPGNPFGLPNGGYGPLDVRPFPNEYEVEVYVDLKTPTTPPTPLEYTVNRRPVPAEGAKAVELPTNVVVDLTTWSDDQPERSRLPVDPSTGFVDVMVAPNGQIVTSSASSMTAPPVNFPFYHFWLTEREDVQEATARAEANNKYWLLPMPANTENDPRMGSRVGNASLNNPTLRSERRLLSVNTRSGAITATAIEVFFLNNPSYPFEAAEAGVKDAQP